MFEGWNPEHVVNLSAQISWPICVVIVGYVLKPSILNFIDAGSGWLKGVKKVSVGDFSLESTVQQQQKSSNDVIIESKSLSSLKENLKDRTSKYTTELSDNIKDSYKSYGLSESEKLDLLTDELSVAITEKAYYMILPTIYLSQINMLRDVVLEKMKIDFDSVEKYFSAIKDKQRGFYAKYNIHTYMLYLLNTGLVSSDESGYSITEYGRGFVVFMSKNQHLLASVKEV